MKLRSFVRTIQPIRPAILAAALVALFAWRPAPAPADAIDDILAGAFIQLPLKRGMAEGNVAGRENDMLLMQRNGVPFKIPVANLRNDGPACYDEAERLIGEQMFHRAAVQLGLARLLDPDNPRRADIEASVMENLGREQEIRDQTAATRRDERIDAARELGRLALATDWPDLQRFLTESAPFLPRHEAGAPVADLSAWDALTSETAPRLASLKTARDHSADFHSRLAAAKSLMKPELSEAEAAAAWIGAPAETAAVDLFFAACGAMWTDILEFEQLRRSHEARVASYRPPTDVLRSRARDALRIQILSDIAAQRSAAGQPPWTAPVDEAAAAMDPVEKRLKADFVHERRTGDGFRYLTTEGDEIFVPVQDWAAFDNDPARPPDTPEEAYLQTPRAGWQSFRDALSALALVAGANPGHPSVKSVLALLQNEARVIYRDEPGLALSTEDAPPAAESAAPEAALSGPPAPATDSPTTPTQQAQPEASE